MVPNVVLCDLDLINIRPAHVIPDPSRHARDNGEFVWYLRNVREQLRPHTSDDVSAPCNMRTPWLRLTPCSTPVSSSVPHASQLRHCHAFSMAQDSKALQGNCQ